VEAEHIDQQVRRRFAEAVEKRIAEWKSQHPAQPQ
jgi:hypothetical protein